MFKFSLSYIIVFSIMFIFSGCVKNDLSPYDYSSNDTSNSNLWAEETNVNDVDTSDIDENLTESETNITEDSQDTQMQRVPFPVAEYNALRRVGKGTVKGQIYISDNDNKIVGSGTRLYLNPITSYSKQWYEESYLGGHKMQKADSRLFNYLRFTAADSDGNFAFYGVPSGNYYLIGTVRCKEECGYETEKSIRIASIVKVFGKNIVKQDLVGSF